MIATVVRPCDNGRSGSEGAGNTARSLTHLLDLGERGLAMKATRPCSIADCGQASYSRGWCTKHYLRWRRHGTTDAPPCRKSKWADASEKFDALVDRGTHDECWPWTGPINIYGYAVLWVPNEKYYVMAHRFGFEREFGPVPDGLALDHTCHGRDESCAGGNDCRHRRCCNPSHLEPVTPAENALRGRGMTATFARRDHCSFGHQYVEGSYYRRSQDGARVCRICTARRNKEYAARIARGKGGQSDA